MARQFSGDLRYIKAHIVSDPEKYGCFFFLGFAFFVVFLLETMTEKLQYWDHRPQFDKNNITLSMRCF